MQRKGFISIPETSWPALEASLPTCLGVKVERTLGHQVGAKLYRIICFSYQLGGFAALAEAVKGGQHHD
jgi:hypothetical protein